MIRCSRLHVAGGQRTPRPVFCCFFFLVLSGTAISFKMKRNALKQKRKLDCHLDLESFQSLITVTWA